MKQKYPEQSSAVALVLSDGSRWSFIGGDEIGSAIVSRLAEVMQLRFCRCSGNRLVVLKASRRGHHAHDTKYSRIQTSSNTPGKINYYSGQKIAGFANNPGKALPSEPNKIYICPVNSAVNNDMPALQLMQAARIIGQYSESRGGLLLHGALVAKEGIGVILAGPGDGGKTTACLRLPEPWQSLCDDTTLVVRDRHDAYWAHPWPTWSRFRFSGNGGTWDVQQAVPLKSIFFLDKSPQDQVKPVGVGESVCALVNLTEQVWGQMQHRFGKVKIQALRLQRFDNICSLVKTVPCYHLCLSREGSFWEEIERVLDQVAYE